MKINFSRLSIVIIFLTMAILGCKKDPPKVIPSISTSTPTNITATTATCGGTISADGGAPVTSRGVCWGLNQSPTTSDNKTSDGSGIGSFTSSITGLTPGGTYYARAYATNAVGTAYGAQATITSTSILAVLTTTDVLGISATSATSGGNISSDGGSAITARGVCWSTNQNPTTKDSLTLNGMGIGSFTSSISRLIPATTYYLKAYATNSIGTAYGNQVIFSTSATLPTITTTALSAVTSKTATGGGNITNDGGSAVTARGVCWSINQSPTISDSKTSNGTGTGIFTSSIISLNPYTTYYVRAYATNIAGTAYGTQVSFATYETVTDIEGNIYNTVTIDKQVWMAENLRTIKFNDGTAIPLVTVNSDWGALTTPGYCWYNNDAATNKSTSGAIYNWHTIYTGRLCPTGWHVPSYFEWTTLITFLGGPSVANDKLKETGTHWPNYVATNESGFTALPSGNRTCIGEFGGAGGSTMWWSSSEYQTAYAWGIYLAVGRDVEYYQFFKKVGCSVRCLKDY